MNLPENDSGSATSIWPAIFLIALLAASALGQATGGRAMPAEFKSDKCTWFPDGDYAVCCVEHDKDYYFGGSLNQRRASDKRLRNCVRSRRKGWKGQVLATGMYIAVRVAGVSFLPTPFRWGFGNEWPRAQPKRLRSKNASHCSRP